jgi:Ribonuclease HII
MTQKNCRKKKRAAAEVLIKEKALWGVAFVDEKEIDRINILEASLLAMSLAFKKMYSGLDAWCRKNGFDKNDFSLEKLSGIADGIYVPEVDIQCQAVVKADAKFPEVMAASILAKTARDSFMTEADKKYPEYGYARHKGYPTAAHKAACRKYGPSPIQRMTFKY